jgi:hypothetical protein
MVRVRGSKRKLPGVELHARAPSAARFRIDLVLQHMREQKKDRNGCNVTVVQHIERSINDEAYWAETLTAAGLAQGEPAWTHAMEWRRWQHLHCHKVMQHDTHATAAKAYGALQQAARMLKQKRAETADTAAQSPRDTEAHAARGSDSRQTCSCGTCPRCVNTFMHGTDGEPDDDSAEEGQEARAPSRNNAATADTITQTLRNAEGGVASGSVGQQLCNCGTCASCLEDPLSETGHGLDEELVEEGLEELHAHRPTRSMASCGNEAVQSDEEGEEAMQQGCGTCAATRGSKANASLARSTDGAGRERDMAAQTAAQRSRGATAKTTEQSKAAQLQAAAAGSSTGVAVREGRMGFVPIHAAEARGCGRETEGHAAARQPNGPTVEDTGQRDAEEVGGRGDDSAPKNLQELYAKAQRMGLPERLIHKWARLRWAFAQSDDKATWQPNAPEADDTDREERHADRGSNTESVEGTCASARGQEEGERAALQHAAVDVANERAKPCTAGTTEQTEAGSPGLPECCGLLRSGVVGINGRVGTSVMPTHLKPGRRPEFVCNATTETWGHIPRTNLLLSMHEDVGGLRALAMVIYTLGTVDPPQCAWAQDSLSGTQTRELMRQRLVNEVRKGGRVAFTKIDAWGQMVSDKRLPPLTYKIPCFVTRQEWLLLYLSMGRELRVYEVSADAAACLMGVMPHMPVWRALQQLHGGNKYAAVGQGVFLPCHEMVIKAAVRVIGWRQDQIVRYACMSMGIGMSAQAAYNAIGASNVRFVFGAEIHEGVREAARQGWAGMMQRIFLTKHMECDVEEMVALGKIDVLDVSDSCAPVSNQSRLGADSERRRLKIEESLDVMYSTLRYAARARPRAIIIENVDWSERYHDIEPQLHAALQAADYDVCLQVGGPEDVGAQASRKRLWILAVAREIGTGRLGGTRYAGTHGDDGSDSCER